MILRSRLRLLSTRRRMIGAAAMLLAMLLCASAAASAVSAAPSSSSPAVSLARAQLELQAAQSAAQAVESDDALTDIIMQQMKTEDTAPVATAAAATPAAPVAAAPVVAALSRPAAVAASIPPAARRSNVPAAPVAAAPSAPVAASAGVPRSAPAAPSATVVVELPDEPELGEAGGNVESALPRAALLRSLQQPGVAASTLPASLTTRAASHMISDTYEAELQEQQEAARINNAELRALDQELEERIDPECPLDGTFQQLRRFGHRLWYEGDITLARVCMDKAVYMYLSPTNSASMSAIASSPVASPTDDPKYRTVLLESAHLPERSFDDFAHVIDMVQRRTERLYAMPWAPVRTRLHEQMKKEGALFWQPHVEQMAKAHTQQRRAAGKGKRTRRKQRKQKKRGAVVKKATVPRKAVPNAKKQQAKPSPAPATAAIKPQPTPSVAAAAATPTRKSL